MVVFIIQDSETQPSKRANKTFKATAAQYKQQFQVFLEIISR